MSTTTTGIISQVITWLTQWEKLEKDLSDVENHHLNRNCVIISCFPILQRRLILQGNLLPRWHHHQRWFHPYPGGEDTAVSQPEPLSVGHRWWSWSWLETPANIMSSCCKHVTPDVLSGASMGTSEYFMPLRWVSLKWGTMVAVTTSAQTACLCVCTLLSYSGLRPKV